MGESCSLSISFNFNLPRKYLAYWHGTPSITSLANPSSLIGILNYFFIRSQNMIVKIKLKNWLHFIWFMNSKIIFSGVGALSTWSYCDADGCRASLCHVTKTQESGLGQHERLYDNIGQERRQSVCHGFLVGEHRTWK